ncbi:MAG: hypothetical protein IPJ75_16295 [Ignavibacteriales bacterium]|nr:hypothetical protein [Ignavibacteriales bacterium]
MLPRLTRAWTPFKAVWRTWHQRTREAQIETDRRIIRDRIAMLSEKLKEIESNRKPD